MISSSFLQRALVTVLAGPLLLLAVWFLDEVVFAGLLAVLLVLSGWEWSRLAELQQIKSRLGYVVLLVAVFALSRLAPIENVMLVALIWWGGALVWLPRFPQGAAWLFGKTERLVAGFFVLIPGVCALEWLHTAHPGLLVFLLLLVWSADIGAYLVGKQFGKRKLAPQVSPGKSIEGVGGALLATSICLMVAFPLLQPLLSSVPVLSVSASVADSSVFGISGFSLFSFWLLGITAIAFSIVGDLVESAYKRSAGIKDSGNLIPGHGGILDRTDSWMAAAPVFVAGLLWLGGS